jgi:hypothetical protein
MKIVVLIGTDHKFQKPIDGPHREGIENFRNTIRQLIIQHDLCAIAEEMNLAALMEDNLQISVAQQISVELGNIPHNFSDPASGKERSDLGIQGSNEIRLEGMNLGWTDEQVDAAIEESYRLREREWLRRIQDFDKWPLLFICGSNHFTHFSILLREAEMNVIEAYRDWGPIIEVRAPTPLYSDDTYPNNATLRHCLSKVRRIATRQLLPNEKVMVKESVCGKDFWALKVEVDGNSSGWILDADGGINISYPAV